MAEFEQVLNLQGRVAKLLTSLSDVHGQLNACAKEQRDALIRLDACCRSLDILEKEGLELNHLIIELARVLQQEVKS